MAAIDGAAGIDIHPGLGGEPWQVAKVYYNQQFTKQRVLALHLAMTDAELESPYHEWLKGWEDRPEDALRVTTRVPAAAWFEVRDRALLAHRTQIDPTGRWFAVPMDLQKSIWPTEDFQLARSMVAVELPEDDLFNGLRGA